MCEGGAGLYGHLFAACLGALPPDPQPHLTPPPSPTSDPGRLQFLRCWPLFGFSPDEVPQLEDLSAVLQQATGFQIRPVAGLVRGAGAGAWLRHGQHTWPLSMLCWRNMWCLDCHAACLSFPLACCLQSPAHLRPTPAAEAAGLSERAGLPHLPLNPGKRVERAG